MTAKLAPGMAHIFDNVTKDVLKDLVHFPSFQEKFRCMTDLLSIEQYRARSLGDNYLSTVFSFGWVPKRMQIGFLEACFVLVC